jgi:hemolysin III
MRVIWTKLREPANGLTHLAGVLLAMLALVILVRVGIASGSLRMLIGLSVFGLSQLALYTASTLHHSLRLSPVGHAWLLRFDVMMVFVLIAGTYTPVCLIALHHVWRWGLLALVWALVGTGLLFTVRWMHAPRWLSTAHYVAIGWVGLLAAPALFHALPTAGMLWMLAGGGVYTVGALIFIFQWPRLIPGVFESHALWHLFVLGGSFCCFWLIVRYVAPLG